MGEKIKLCTLRNALMLAELMHFAAFSTIKVIFLFKQNAFQRLGFQERKHDLIFIVKKSHRLFSSYFSFASRNKF